MLTRHAGHAGHAVSGTCTALMHSHEIKSVCDLHHNHLSTKLCVICTTIICQQKRKSKVFYSQHGLVQISRNVFCCEGQLAKRRPIRGLHKLFLP